MQTCHNNQKYDRIHFSNLIKLFNLSQVDMTQVYVSCSGWGLTRLGAMLARFLLSRLQNYCGRLWCRGV